MAVCNFRQKEFGNAQAVRAHLKGCVAYKAKNLTQPLSGSSDAQGNAYTDIRDPLSADFDPVRRIQQRVTTERLRLKLREIERAHAALDEETASRQTKEAELKAQRRSSALAEKREREALRLKEEAAARASLVAKKQQEQLNARRRKIIQEVKSEVMEWWGLRYSGGS